MSGDASNDDTVAAQPGSVDATLPVGPATGVEATVASTSVVIRSTSPPAIPGTGQHLVLGRELARGGMGRVIVAEDKRLERTVALKLLQVVTPGLRARFDREALITARLAHPAIVPIYEAGTLANGEPYYAMKLVDGVPLDRAVANAKTLPERLALVPAALKVCEALAYAHSRRVIHRDLKPANVLVGAFGEVIVIDWGLAKDLDSNVSLPPADAKPASSAPEDSGATVDGEVMGTPSYMPPEQARGETVGERADVYALGALLYHVIAGHPPYKGKTAGEILAAVLVGPPRALAAVEPRVPDDLASIVARAMQREPAARYATAGELADELRRFIDGRLVAAHRYTRLQLLRRFVARHKVAFGIGTAAAVAIAATATISIRKIVAHDRATARALAENQLEHGRQLLADGDAAHAAPLLETAAAALPDSPLAARMLAFAAHDRARAIADLDSRGPVAFVTSGALAVAHPDGTIAIVDTSSGHTARTYKVGANPTQLVAAPDGLVVVTPTGAELVDAATGSTHTVLGAATEVLALADHTFVLASPTGIARVDTSHVIAQVDVAQPHALALSRDGKAIVVVTRDGAAAFGLDTLAQVASISIADNLPFAAAYDGSVFVTAGVGGIDRYPVGVPVHATLRTEATVMLAWLPDGDLAADGALVHPHLGSTDLLTRATVQAIAPTKQGLVTGGYDRTLRVFDFAHRDTPITLATNAATESIAVDPTNHYAVSLGKTAVAQLWNIGPQNEPKPFGIDTAAIDALLVAPDGARVAVHTNEPRGTRLVVASGPGPLVTGWPVAFTPDGGTLVTDLDGALLLFDRTGTKLREIREPDKIWRVAFDAATNQIATSTSVGVTIRDAAWKPIRKVATGDTTALAFADNTIAVGYADGGVELWSAATGSRIATNTLHHAAQVSLLSIHGTTLASDSWDNTTLLWSTTDLAPRGELDPYETAITSIARSPDGLLLATADGTSTIAIREATHGRLVTRVVVEPGTTQVAFLDAHRLVAGGAILELP